jgi:peptide/nickel transport system permease protein
MGLTYLGRTSVSKKVFDGLIVSAIIGFATLAISVSLSLPLGVLAAKRAGTRMDTLVTVGSQLGVAVPSYLLAPLLILIFGIYLGWLPSAGWRGPLFVILPVLTLMVSPLAFFAQVTRASMIEALSMDYIRTARAKGLSEWVVTLNHALRNAMIPVVTLASMWLAGLIGGALIVEVIFALPGVGRVLFDAIQASDMPLIQASLVMIVIIAVAINTLTDILYIILNPAIRLEGAIS